MSKSFALILSLALSAGGCAAINNLRGGGSSGSSKGGSGASVASSGAPTEGAALVSSKLSYTNVRATDQAHYIFRQMGAEHSHPLEGGNPDKAWIPGWEKLSSDEAAEVAIAQAAVNRTWTEAVNREFGTWWAAFSPVVEHARTQIAAITASADSHYAKIAALNALWKETAKSPAAATQYGKYLLQFQFATAAAAIHKAANVEFATYSFIVGIGADTGFGSHGRAIGSEAEEKQQFMFAAMNSELEPLLPALPKMEEEGNGTTVVKWPLAGEAWEQLAASRKAAAEVATALYAKPADVASFDHEAAPGRVVYLNATGDDHVADGFTSKKVTAIGKDSITLAGKLNKMVPYDCKTYIVTASDGFREPRQDCKYKHDDTNITVTLEVDALPPLKLQVGDQVSVRGTVKDYKTSKNTVNARLSDVYIESVHRGQQRVFGG